MQIQQLTYSSTTILAKTLALFLKGKKEVNFCIGKKNIEGGRRWLVLKGKKNIDEHLLHMLHSTQGTQHKIT